MDWSNLVTIIVSAGVTYLFIWLFSIRKTKEEIKRLRTENKKNIIEAWDLERESYRKDIVSLTQQIENYRQEAEKERISNRSLSTKLDEVQKELLEMKAQLSEVLDDNARLKQENQELKSKRNVKKA